MEHMLGSKLGDASDRGHGGVHEIDAQILPMSLADRQFSPRLARQMNTDGMVAVRRLMSFSGEKQAVAACFGR
jgi:hypothetical protein